jgi:BirA family biotin operon repressor/biotin-[acetyl-CoA-carboxylase] ligase
VTIGAAVAVARAVKALCGLELSIKWVNDLYYQGRKVCGILTEAGTDIESGQLEWLVVGIGLNLTSRPEDWPEELRPIAGSLYPGGPAPVSRAALAGAIARELLGLCPAFDCLDEYRARCFVPGHWVTVCTGTESYAAKAVAIDDAGRLIVAREGGRTEALCHGEVSIRPSPLAVK